MSTASRPHVACIRQERIIWTGNHEHRQLQFKILFWSFLTCITISYIHAPSTVKGYCIANYEKRYLCPIERPRTYWLLPPAHFNIFEWGISSWWPAVLPTEAWLRCSAFFVHVLFAWWMYGDVSLTFSTGNGFVTTRPSMTCARAPTFQRCSSLQLQWILDMTDI